MSTSEQPILIKRYAHRRLYRPGTGTYVTLDDLALMAEDDEDFVVLEAETGADVTASVLKHIIRQRATHG
jgi:polyhydroxyalkanoate synthesis regulator protein